MKKNIILVAMALLSISATAQETYENATVTDQDLNGTARYVGMGGAMEALGADISTMSTNPAGIGLFRRSQFTISGGLNSIAGQDAVLSGKKTRPSFDQIGFVFTMPSSSLSGMNLGFNYHKSKNFSQLMNVTGDLGGKASQNKLSFNKYNNGLADDEMNTFSQVDYLYDEAFFSGNNPLDDDYINSTSYLLRRSTKGYIGDYDFNISGSIDSRLYLGMTIGIHDVNYKSESSYLENFVTGKQAEIYDSRNIHGTGFDIKFGAIWRPIETTPFRIGVYLNTPTWYDLTTENYTYISQNTGFGASRATTSENYDYKLFTPWKMGISLGHTIGRNIALGATYEFADYNTLDSRIVDSGYYSYDGYVENSVSDNAMNKNTRQSLKGVSTIKVGAEYKPIDLLAIRLGYNYISPKYNTEKGYKDSSIDSYGSYYASQTDYTNWKATNRITFGLGYTIDKHWSVDVAYQYTQTDGDFSPFMPYYGDTELEYNNVAGIENVSNKRHQILFTIGYRF